MKGRECRPWQADRAGLRDQGRRWWRGRSEWGRRAALMHPAPVADTSRRFNWASLGHVASKPYRAWGATLESMTLNATSVLTFWASEYRRGLREAAFFSAQRTCSREDRLYVVQPRTKILSFFGRSDRLRGLWCSNVIASGIPFLAEYHTLEFFPSSE